MNHQQVTVKHFLKNRILWKVYLVWFLRRIVPLIILQLALFSIALLVFSQKVFVSKVFTNAAVTAGFGYWSLLKYMFYSFVNTRPITQVVILILLGVFALLIRDAIRMIVTYQSMWIRGKSEAK